MYFAETIDTGDCIEMFNICTSLHYKKQIDLMWPNLPQ